MVSTFNINLIFKHFFLSGLLLFSVASFADGHNERENRLISAFVYKVAKFITWPQIDESSEKTYFNLCVVDNASFSRSLKQAVNSRRIANLEIQVKNVGNELEIKHCHLLYFQGVTEKTVFKFIDKTKNRPILTVANTPNFIEQGGMIAFNKNQNKIALLINNKNAQKEGLIISSHLLRLNRFNK